MMHRLDFLYERSPKTLDFKMMALLTAQHANRKRHARGQAHRITHYYRADRGYHTTNYIHHS